jgi:hypothetical protein
MCSPRIMRGSPARMLRSFRLQRVFCATARKKSLRHPRFSFLPCLHRRVDLASFARKGPQTQEAFLRKPADKTAILEARARLQTLRDAFTPQEPREDLRFVLLEGAQVAIAPPRGRPVVPRDPRAQRRA